MHGHKRRRGASRGSCGEDEEKISRRVVDRRGDEADAYKGTDDEVNDMINSPPDEPCAYQVMNTLSNADKII